MSLTSVQQIKMKRNMDIKANKSINKNIIDSISKKRKGHLQFNIFQFSFNISSLLMDC